MNKINLKGVTAEAVIGVLLLVVALANSVLTMLGYQVLPIQEENVSDIVSSAFLIITALYNTYKNRNLTTASQEAQMITDAIKNGEVLVEQVEEFIAPFKKK